MNDTYIVTTFVVMDDLLQLMKYQDDSRVQICTSEIILIAVIAAKYFYNHHERAVCMLVRLGYVSPISVSRFNRRLHQSQNQILAINDLLALLLQTGQVFMIDTMPLPACKRIRAQRCRKVKGKAYYGYCASKQEYYFGWQLHLVCDARGVPVAFDILPARWDELVPLQHLLADLPADSQIVADKGYISSTDEQLAYIFGNVRFIPQYRKNMRGNSESDATLIRQHRSMIETVNSQLEKMGLQHLYARTTTGFVLKTVASLIALAFTNAN